MKTKMKTSLLTALVSTLLTGTALAATGAAFDQGAPKPADVIASARGRAVPAIKDAGPVAVAPAKAAPAPLKHEAGEAPLRIVETYVAGGKASVEKESACLREDGSTTCIDTKTLEPAKLPADLADFDFKRTIQEALALAAKGEFRLAHVYQTRQGGQCFVCWGVYDGNREVGHACSEIDCR